MRFLNASILPFFQEVYKFSNFPSLKITQYFCSIFENLPLFKGVSLFLWVNKKISFLLCLDKELKLAFLFCDYWSLILSLISWKLICEQIFSKIWSQVFLSTIITKVFLHFSRFDFASSWRPIRDLSFPGVYTFSYFFFDLFSENRFLFSYDLYATQLFRKWYVAQTLIQS